MAAAGFPNDVEIRSTMEQLMREVNLETMSTKQFIMALQDRFGGIDLSSRKKFIKATITEIIDAMENEKNNDDEEEESEEEEEESEEEEEVQQEVAAPKKKKRASGGGGGGGGGGGLAAVKEISDVMSAFLGCGKYMARTAVVKGLWDYIKANNLQNPNDKREILLDERMRSVFGVDRFTMFSMNKYLSPHIEPFKPVDLSAPSSSSKKRKSDGGGKGKKGGKKAKGERKSGTQAPYRLSDQLSAVVGKNILPRPQVTQALWVYIRKNNLQNPEDKREIICDDLLRPVMGGQDRVTMFSMNKFISPHMLEKLDKSAYVHEEMETNTREEEEDDEEEESDDE